MDVHAERRAKRRHLCAKLGGVVTGRLARARVSFAPTQGQAADGCSTWNDGQSAKLSAVCHQGCWRGAFGSRVCTEVTGPAQGQAAEGCSTWNDGRSQSLLQEARRYPVTGATGAGMSTPKRRGPPAGTGGRWMLHVGRRLSEFTSARSSALFVTEAAGAGGRSRVLTEETRPGAWTGGRWMFHVKRRAEPVHRAAVHP